MFVTWKIHIPNKSKSEQKSALRGCIGTFAKENLQKTLPLYSLLSAFKDERFRPIKMAEVPLLSCSVSLLENFTKIKDPYDWTIGKHGVQIEFDYKGKNYGSTFLPQVAQEQNWTKEETIEELIRKSGCKDGFKSIKNLMKIERYESALSSASYSEYNNFIKTNKDLL